MKGLFLKYRPEIDGLRALAVLPVILFHAGNKLFSGGFIGVDIFFVISGYLITTILVEDIENNRFSIVNFYERRARRILPALFFVMLVCIPLAWMWMLPSQMKDFSQSLIAVSLFGSNILFWLESGYFEASAEEKPLLHTWSLAVEEQYYLLFPIFLFLSWRFGKNRVFWIIVMLAAISLMLSEWGLQNKPAANFYLAITRAWELFAGSIAAFVIQKRGVQSSNTLSCIGLAAVVFAIFTYDDSMPFPGAYALIPVLGVVLLVLFADKETYVAKFLSAKIFVGIGLISYSAYLWHQPLFAFARIRLIKTPSYEFLLLIAVLSMVLAFFSWKYIEKPYRKKGVLQTSKTGLFGKALSGFALFIVFGLAGINSDGFKGRFPVVADGDVNSSDFYDYMNSRYVDCEPKEIAKNALEWEGVLRCKQSREGHANWVLLGDSHAEHLFLGLAEAFPSKNIVYYILGDEPYFRNESFQTIFSTLISSDLPQKIFLTMHYVGRAKDPNVLFSELAETILELQNAGHEVVLLGDIPRYDIHPEECANKMAAMKTLCSMSKTEAIAQSSIYHDTLTKLSARFSIDYYPISEPLCTKKQCGMFLGTTILYRDYNHLNITGSILIGQHLANSLAPESKEEAVTKTDTYRHTPNRY
tara:strand:- start:1943 stop:3871 length:1929 start_codon:yes stop_codon:yes gene_type:complete